MSRPTKKSSMKNEKNHSILSLFKQQTIRQSFTSSETITIDLSTDDKNAEGIDPCNPITTKSTESTRDGTRKRKLSLPNRGANKDYELSAKNQKIVKVELKCDNGSTQSDFVNEQTTEQSAQATERNEERSLDYAANVVASVEKNNAVLSADENSNGNTNQHLSSLLTSDSSKESTENEQENVEELVPYYLKNFHLIIKSVTEDLFFKDLFDDEDISAINAFNSSSDQSQKIYVRLFGRNFRWIRLTKITYPDVASDLKNPLEELVHNGLLHGIDDLEDLSSALHALAAPELKELAKTLHIPPNQTRLELIKAMQKHGQKKGIGSFFSGAVKGSDSMILNRAKKILGDAYKLRKTARCVFLRTMMLFGLHRTNGEEDESGATAQQQLFQMLMSNIGRLKYPSYTVNRKSHIFPSKASLLSFSEALQMETEMREFLEIKDYTSAAELFQKARAAASFVWEKESEASHAASLPAFLRCFTAGAVYARVLSLGVELQQYTKQYSTAVELLRLLIGQDLYHVDYRGRWYDRLALNLDYHLKKTKEAVDVIHTALQDPHVQVGHRLALYQRAHKICHTSSHRREIKDYWSKFENDIFSNIKEYKRVKITAMQMPALAPGASHAGHVWVLPSGDGDAGTAGEELTTLVKRVEDVALAHYRAHGYPNGIHSESGTFTMIMCLLYWDQIYRDDLPDVFYHEFQSYPLDIQTAHFYEARAEEINTRTKTIKDMDCDLLQTSVGSAWDLHHGTFCVGVNWERFESKEHLLGLVGCLGGAVIAAVCERLLRNMRFCSSGMPDLVVWNTEESTYKLVEVKGPGDKLSTKQILWLDYFMQQNIHSEVCYVEGISTKKIKT